MIYTLIIWLELIITQFILNDSEQYEASCNANRKTADVYNRMSLVSTYVSPGDLKIISYHVFIFYSVLNDFIGLAIAAFIAWKLIVANAISNADAPAKMNIHQPIFTLRSEEHTSALQS